ncbi:hypothetical protein VTN96DRAFT_1952 [Rasamsonia emersonii]
MRARSFLFVATPSAVFPLRFAAVGDAPASTSALITAGSWYVLTALSSGVESSSSAEGVDGSALYARSSWMIFDLRLRSPASSSASCI